MSIVCVCCVYVYVCMFERAGVQLELEVVPKAV